MIPIVLVALADIELGVIIWALTFKACIRRWGR